MSYREEYDARSHLEEIQIQQAGEIFRSLERDHGVKIYPEYLAVAYRPTRKEAMVRITDPLWPVRPLKHHDMFSAVTAFAFDDVESPKHGRIMFKLEGEKMWEFFEKNREVEVMNFHCMAGISRSAGAAVAWARFKGDAKAEELIWGNPLLCPNKLVIETISSHF